MVHVNLHHTVVAPIRYEDRLVRPWCSVQPSGRAELGGQPNDRARAYGPHCPWWSKPIRQVLGKAVSRRFSTNSHGNRPQICMLLCKRCQSTYSWQVPIKATTTTPMDGSAAIAAGLEPRPSMVLQQQRLQLHNSTNSGPARSAPQMSLQSPQPKPPLSSPFLPQRHPPPSARAYPSHDQQYLPIAGRRAQPTTSSNQMQYMLALLVPTCSCPPCQPQGDTQAGRCQSRGS